MEIKEHTQQDSGARLPNVAADYLADGLEAWLSVNCACAEGPGRHARQVHAAAVFCAFCVPRAELDQEALIAAKCCLLFFLIDDGPAEQLAEFTRFLDTGDRSGNEPAACLLSLIEDLSALGCDTGDVRSAIRNWAASMQREQDMDPGNTLPEAHYALRRQTIFVSCLVFCWLSLMRAGIPQKYSAECKDLLEIAVRMVILANDLGSMHADGVRAEGAESLVDINSVLVRSRILGTRQRAVEEAVLGYNSLALDFQEREFELIRRMDSVDEELITFLEVIRSVANGNLAGTRHLTGERYPGSSETLMALHDI
jgi:Terpene synthase family 2, C-terminal metal binding